MSRKQPVTLADRAAWVARDLEREAAGPKRADPASALLREHDDKAAAAEHGYEWAKKARTAHLPGALPSSWATGDPAPTDAEALDPWADGGERSAEARTDGDDFGVGPLERMAVRDETPSEPDDPDQGKYRGPPWPDRRRDPWGWEMFFRSLARAAPYSMRQTPWTLARAMLGPSSVCRWDNAEFQQAATGRLREYCSDACQQAAYRERRRRVTKPG